MTNEEIRLTLLNLDRAMMAQATRDTRPMVNAYEETIGSKLRGLRG